MNEKIVLESGRVLTPNCGILGLEWYHGRWALTEGYDNTADVDDAWGRHHGRGDYLTTAEKYEIAKLMIMRWLAWRDGR